MFRSRRRETYKMVKRERQSLNLLVSSINKASNGKLIGFIDRLGTLDRVDHRTGDNVRINHHQIVGGGIHSHELPCSHLGLGLRHVVSKNGVLSFYGLLGCHLCSCEIQGSQRWVQSFLTGFQSFSVYAFPSLDWSSKELSTDTALPSRTKRFKVVPPWR